MPITSQRTMHEEPQIKCPKCEKAFHFKSRLLEHLRTHQREIKVKVAKVKKVIKKEPIPRPVPVLCSHCDKSCRSNAILNRHLQICGPRTCNVCEQNFDKYNSYRKHMVGSPFQRYVTISSTSIFFIISEQCTRVRCTDVRIVRERSWKNFRFKIT